MAKLIGSRRYSGDRSHFWRYVEALCQQCKLWFRETRTFGCVLFFRHGFSTLRLGNIWDSRRARGFFQNNTVRCGLLFDRIRKPRFYQLHQGITFVGVSINRYPRIDSFFVKGHVLVLEEVDVSELSFPFSSLEDSAANLIPTIRLMITAGSSGVSRANSDQTVDTETVHRDFRQWASVFAILLRRSFTSAVIRKSHSNDPSILSAPLEVIHTRNPHESVSNLAVSSLQRFFPLEKPSMSSRRRHQIPIRDAFHEASLLMPSTSSFPIYPYYYTFSWTVRVRSFFRSFTFFLPNLSLWKSNTSTHTRN